MLKSNQYHNGCDVENQKKEVEMDSRVDKLRSSYDMALILLMNHYDDGVPKTISNGEEACRIHKPVIEGILENYRKDISTLLDFDIITSEDAIELYTKVDDYENILNK